MFVLIPRIGKRFEIWPRYLYDIVYQMIEKYKTKHKVTNVISPFFFKKLWERLSPGLPGYHTLLHQPQGGGTICPWDSDTVIL